MQFPPGYPPETDRNAGTSAASTSITLQLAALLHVATQPQPLGHVVRDASWDSPQISSSLPSGNLAVYNANTAVSTGLELETSGPLALGFGYSLGYSYTDAKLSSDFSLPANEEGTITPGALTGVSGQQMPGSPKNSLSAALLYDTRITQGYDLSMSLNAVYLLDKQEILVPPTQPGAGNDLNGLANDNLVNPPRQIGVRIGYKFR